MAVEFFTDRYLRLDSKGRWSQVRKKHKSSRSGSSGGGSSATSSVAPSNTSTTRTSRETQTITVNPHFNFSNIGSPNMPGGYPNPTPQGAAVGTRPAQSEKARLWYVYVEKAQRAADLEANYNWNHRRLLDSGWTLTQANQRLTRECQECAWAAQARDDAKRAYDNA